MKNMEFRVWDEKRKIMWYPENMQHGNMVESGNCGRLIWCDIEQIAIGANGKIYILDLCNNYEYPENIGESYKPMFYIGVKDRNNRKIYEGDVIKLGFKFSNEFLIGIVRYNEELARFQVKSSSDFTGVILTESLKMAKVLEEVIGNEFENPELLKKVLSV